MPRSFRLNNRTEHHLTALQARLDKSATAVVEEAIEALWEAEGGWLTDEMSTDFVWSLVNSIAEAPSDRVRVRFTVTADGNATGECDPPRGAPLSQFVTVALRRDAGASAAVIELIGLPSTKYAGQALNVATVPLGLDLDLVVALEDLDPALRPPDAERSATR